MPTDDSGGVVMQRSLTREVLLGTGAAVAATKVMDRVTTAYHERQSDASKRRERELLDQPAYTVAAERLAEMQGVEIDQEQAEQLGQRLHLGLGMSGGAVAGFLAARGMNPVVAGILTGLGIWVVVDEGANAVLGITPPAPAYPRETHIRGLLGHLAYGGALGALLGLGSLLFARKRNRD
jgi:hypothetical protein